MRSKIIAGNWKMNNGLKMTQDFVRSFEEWFALSEDVYALTVEEKLRIVIFPPFTSLSSATHLTEISPVNLGAQNIYWKEQGAFTGEVSAPMIKELGCSYCLVGHSERRSIFKESNEAISKKIATLLAYGITPVLCVGEVLVEREGGSAFNAVKKQLVESLEAVVTPHNLSYIVIAYEPVWAIGTGKTASAQDAQIMCKYIRDYLADAYGEESAGNTHILYGGSANAQNTADLISQEDIDGLLVGGASLKVASFSEILKECAGVVSKY